MAIYTADVVWRDFATDGVPSGGNHAPIKADIRAWGRGLEAIIAAGVLSGAVWKATKSALDSDLEHAADTAGIVYADSAPGNNGIYTKNLASGLGSWTQRFSYLPGYQFIACSDVGAGTANAIQITSSIPAPSSPGVALFNTNVYRANTGEVTISLNGATAKPMVTASGLALGSGYLQTGMRVLFVDDGAQYRLVTDVASAAIQAAAEAARDIAVAAAASVLVVDYNSISALSAASVYDGAQFVRLAGYAAAGDGGGALYKRVALEPTHAGKVQSGDGKWWEIAESVPTTAMFGVVADGVTQTQTSFQAAITAAHAIGCGCLYIPAGIYLISGIITNPGIRIYGAGRNLTTIKKTGLLNLFVAAGASFSEGTNNTLAANVVAGSRSITLGAGYAAAFAVGQTCILKDEGPWGGLYSGTPPRNGEFVTIQNITGDVVTFWSPIRLSYTTANTARLVAINQLHNVSYSDFTVVMDDTQDPHEMWNNGPNPSDITTVGAAFSGVALYRPEFRNIEVRNALGPGIMLAGCLNARISSFRGSDFGSATTGTVLPDSTDGTGGFGYGICEAELNEGLVATDLEFERVRHGYTSVGGNQFYNDCGVPTGSIIANGVHRDAKDMAWDTHAQGDGIVFDNLVAIGGRGCGFQIRSRRHRVLNCTAINCAAAGLWVRGGASSNSLQGNSCDIENFRAFNTNTSTYYPGGINWTNYGAIVDDGNDTTIDGARVSGSGGPLITMGGFIAPLRPSYRNIRGDALCQITTTKPYAVDIIQIGIEGKARIDGLEVRSADGRVTHLIYRARAGDQIAMHNIHGIGHTGDVYASGGRDGIIDGSVALTNSDAPMLAQSSPKVFLDDFDGTALKPGWTTVKGSNGSCALAAIASLPNGCIRLTTGADAGGTMALNGTQIAGELNWRPDVGGLATEFRVKMNAVTNVAVFVGLTDQVAALEMPFELGAGDALTSNASNACGVLFDTAADTDNWWFCGVKADTDATKQDSGKAPVGTSWERWRIVVATDGTARFYWEGALVGTIMTNATTPSTRLCLVVAALSRSSASRLIDVDYIAAEQTRTSVTS